MTHTELVKIVAQKTDLKPTEAAILWQETSKILVRELAKKEKIRIKNFGSFLVVKHKSRTVPDPRQMTKKLVILDQYLPKFRPSEQLRAKAKLIVPKQLAEKELAAGETDEPIIKELQKKTVSTPTLKQIVHLDSENREMSPTQLVDQPELEDKKIPSLDNDPIQTLDKKVILELVTKIVAEGLKKKSAQIEIRSDKKGFVLRFQLDE